MVATVIMRIVELIVVNCYRGTEEKKMAASIQLTIKLFLVWSPEDL